MAIQDAVEARSSRCPAIGKTYGKPAADGMRVTEQAGPLKHMARVNRFKTTHDGDHGHAQARVARFLAPKH